MSATSILLLVGVATLAASWLLARRRPSRLTSWLALGVVLLAFAALIASVATQGF